MKQLFNIFFLTTVLAIGTATVLQAQNFKLPAYQKFTLKNGLTVYLMEQKEVPMISVSAIFPAGAIFDGEKAGLASLTAAALQHGTASYSKQELDQQIDFIGASINSYANKEYAGLSSSFASKDTEKMLGILNEVLTAPRFDTAEFTKEKKRALIRLEQQKESPRSVIGSYFDKFLYGEHVYGNIVSGTPATVQPLSAADIRAFYTSHYIPNGSAIAIAGDFDAKQMKALVTKAFSGWKKAPAVLDVSAKSAILKPSGNRVLLVNKNDARETTFYIGAPGISRNNPDYIAIDVINTLLGGRFTSMLNDELRVNSGLTYGARSSFSTLKYGGSFAISTFTATENTEAAIDKSLEVLNRLHAQGVTEESLTSAKNYVKGQFPPDFETSRQLASLMTQMFWYGFNESFINNFQANVDGLTLDKARQIIQTYFPKDKLQFILVGKSEEIKKLAEKYGPVTEVQITGEKKAF
jgi:predicted Zn-dependent peptidase